MKMKEFKSFAEKRRQKRFLEERALRDLESHGGSKELVETVRSLLNKGVVCYKQLESGDFVLNLTEEGKETLEKVRDEVLGESGDDG